MVLLTLLIVHNLVKVEAQWVSKRGIDFIVRVSSASFNVDRKTTTCTWSRTMRCHCTQLEASLYRVLDYEHTRY